MIKLVHSNINQIQSNIKSNDKCKSSIHFVLVFSLFCFWSPPFPKGSIWFAAKCSTIFIIYSATCLSAVWCRKDSVQSIFQGFFPLMKTARKPKIIGKIRSTLFNCLKKKIQNIEADFSIISSFIPILVATHQNCGTTLQLKQKSHTTPSC